MATNRVLLAVGADEYRSMPRLYGAERDARAIAAALLAPRGDYDPQQSVLLSSPTLSELRDALRRVSETVNQPTVVTFYFAGHGGSKAGNYYLCVKDSDISRLSTTALMLSELLAFVLELGPTQVNVVLDACESGAAMWDSASLLRSDVLSGVGSSGVSFFAACGPNEYASEESGGGIATAELLAYLRNEKELQSTRPFLDLVDLGRKVSGTLQAASRGQVPVTWGLNLFGEGQFARNPFFRESGSLEQTQLLVRGIAPDSRAGLVIRKYADVLWAEHRQVSEDPALQRLIRHLEIVCEELTKAGEPVAPFLRGVTTSLRARAAESRNSFAELEVNSACLALLLSWRDTPGAGDLFRVLLAEQAELNRAALTGVYEQISQGEFSMMNERHVMSDLYYLPLRLTKVIGWGAASLLAQNLMGAVGDASQLLGIIRHILNAYSGSCVVVSDEQQPYLYLAAKACDAYGWHDERETLLGLYFGSVIDSQGVIARPYLVPERVFEFLLARASGTKPHRELCANPLHVLGVLLLLGAKAGLDDEWDYDLRELDRTAANVFVPKRFTDFGQLRIEDGHNFTFQLGLGIWTLADVSAFVSERAMPEINKAAESLDRETAAAAILASCALPERVPMFLELPAWHRLLAPSASREDVTRDSNA